jgi:UDP-4-amino-4-deoxy-L-arabinose-oxoglutarate aminotransferase
MRPTPWAPITAEHHVGETGTAIFSFHPIKNITTGEGGMFCTDDPKMAERISRLKFHGLGVDAYDRETQGRSPQAEVLEPGYKYNMTDMAAVLGLRQLHRVNQFNRKRSQLAARYLEWLADVDEICPSPSRRYHPACLAFVYRAS